MKDIVDDEFETEGEPQDPPDEDPRVWLKRRKMKRLKKIPFDDWRTPAEIERDDYANPRNYQNYGMWLKRSIICLFIYLPPDNPFETRNNQLLT